MACYSDVHWWRQSEEEEKDQYGHGYTPEQEALDEEWKATLILDHLENTPPPPNNTKTPPPASQRNTPFLFENTPQVPWLNALTKKRCHQILSDHESEKRSHHSPSSSSTPSYLVIELPTPPHPVIHEETIYPPPLHGASGSVTAFDLSLYRRRVNHSKVQEDNDMGLSLVRFLDHENDENNPVEDKYRTLAHDLLRGLVDPQLKPDREQRARLASVINSPSHHPTMEEKDLLWRFRFSLVDNRRALTKFLLAVDWTQESEVIQAAELLEQWRKRSPIEVTDALKLLGKNVAFQTSLVRAYAIDTLAAAPDEELSLYLLQLVQALKYENMNHGNDRMAESTATLVVAPQQGGVSSLASFLIDRASKNMSLANYLYWYLKVELPHPTHGQRYRAVFSALGDKLSSIPLHHLKKTKPTQQSSSSILSKLSSSQPYTPKTMWDILLAQDQFISGVMECQMQSRDYRGKRDAKEKQLRELLGSRGYHFIQSREAIPLPSAPEVYVTGVYPPTARMFKSALYPAVIEFCVTPSHTADKSSSQTVDLLDTHTPSSFKQDNYKVIVKTGDDLRQDQLVIMMVRLMNGLLKRGTLDLCLKPYSIIATSPTAGLVGFVEHSLPVSHILSSYNNSILQFFRAVAPKSEAPYGVQPEVMTTYVRSCAGYCVITYLLGVGDRHLDNLMLLPTGHFFHIDFGYILGRDPKPLPPPFRLTREMVDGMGGINSPDYKRFCSLACQAYNLLRKSASLVLNLLELMSDAGIEDLSNNPTADAEGVIAKVEERFRLELTDEQAESYFLGLIGDSMAALAPRVMDMIHTLAVSRR